ncbi:hypothetical protein ML462_00710 [Gramella lutea]|uniref:Uncharacterized protein n=1 Tax=Christiangramia lutea TaxID=1607951 RepID=A0A9X2A7Y4_9FLAO|nr:hypothetical protein [Christiangramia lutea]MCH4821680.1 hypothetical protein [Christiangramia lutea]
MKKLVILLICLNFYQGFGQSYENGLNREEVVAFSFDLIDEFYRYGGMTEKIAEWLNISTENEFKKIIPEFTNPNNRNVRDKILSGIAEDLCIYIDNCEPNLYAITRNVDQAKYWSNYIIENYFEIPEEKTEKISENKFRYIQGWVLENENSELQFLIAGKIDSDECLLRIRYKEKSYIAKTCNDYEGKAILVNEDGQEIKINFSIPEMVSPMIDIEGTSKRFDFVDVLDEIKLEESDYRHLLEFNVPRIDRF